MMTVDQALETIEAKMEEAGYEGTYVPKNIYARPEDFQEIVSKLSERDLFVIAVVNEDPGAEESLFWMIATADFFKQDFR